MLITGVGTELTTTGVIADVAEHTPVLTVTLYCPVDDAEIVCVVAPVDQL